MLTYIRNNRRYGLFDFIDGNPPLRRIDPRWHILWVELDCIYPCPSVLTYCRSGSYAGDLDVTFLKPDKVCEVCWTVLADYAGDVAAYDEYQRRWKIVYE